MSQAAIQEFYGYVQTQPQLQEKLNALMDNREAMIDEAVKLAQQNNYTFTKEELQEVIASLESAMSGETELSDQQLESVAGGANKPGSSGFFQYQGPKEFKYEW